MHTGLLDSDIVGSLDSNIVSTRKDCFMSFMGTGNSSVTGGQVVGCGQITCNMCIFVIGVRFQGGPHWNFNSLALS